MKKPQYIIHWCFDEVLEGVIPDNGGPMYSALECLHQAYGNEKPMKRGFICNYDEYPLQVIVNHFSKSIEPLLI
jgi:hypothetical protein